MNCFFACNACAIAVLHPGTWLLCFALSTRFLFEENVYNSSLLGIGRFGSIVCAYIIALQVLTPLRGGLDLIKKITNASDMAQPRKGVGVLEK